LVSQPLWCARFIRRHATRRAKLSGNLPMAASTVPHFANDIGLDKF
jgi:hypothetical protein